MDVSLGDRFSSSPDSDDEDVNTFKTFLDCLQHIEETTKTRKIPGSVQQMATKIHSSCATIASGENFVSSDWLKVADNGLIMAAISEGKIQWDFHKLISDPI